MRIRAALAQLNTTVGDTAGNKKKILIAIDKARSVGAGLLVFPELAVTGYPPKDLLFDRSFLRDNSAVLKDVIDYTADDGLLVILGFVDVSTEIYNAAAAIQSGELKGVYRKMELRSYPYFDERRYFSAGSHPLRLNLEWSGLEIAIGDELWNLLNVEDKQKSGKASLIVNLSARAFVAGRTQIETALLLANVEATSRTLLCCNLVGGQDGLVFQGGSAVVAPGGLARGKSFEEDFIVLDMELEPTLKDCDTLEERESQIINLYVPQRDIETTLKETPPKTEIADEWIGAIELGLGDYLRKNGFEKVVLGLSGGMDSSLVAALAVRALGKENVKGVLLPSRITSSQSRNDALKLAENLGIETLEVSIESVFASLNATMKPIFAGEPFDVTEENFQSRIRGMILMGLSNKFGWFLLATGNKSETATGYSTLYGDMAGGLAVIGDLYKTQVYMVAERINQLECREVIPESVFLKAPTAELREGQKDQDWLPPYGVLDEILRLRIEEGYSLEKILASGFDRSTVEFVLALLRKNEYKRAQAAPVIKVSKRSLDKDWLMPMTNGYRDKLE